MNLGIQHGGRKANTGGGMKLPREVAQMAKQMGIDMSEMGGQAENMWSMLNDMSQNDPEAYDSFIKEQMDGAQEEAEENKKKSRTFTPIPCFVVKAKFSNANSGLKIKNACGVDASGKLFVNVCSHDGIQRPLDTQGNPVAEDRPSLDNIQIPLVVGDLRPTTDASGETVAAVDIVFNPWCIKMVESNNVFRAQIVELGLNWLQQEQHCKLERRWKVIKSKYKGGTGDRGDSAILFPIDDSMLDPKDLEKEKEQERKAKEELDKIKKGFEEKMGGARPPGKLVEEITTTSVLEKIKKQKDAELADGTEGGGQLGGGGLGDMGIGDVLNLGRGQQRGDKKKPLIQEVGKDKKPLIQEVEKEKPKGKKGKPLTKQMKGFFNKTAAKKIEIYGEEGSSGDGQGGAGGSYARFMGKCKVVDTSTMSESEQKKMMEQHANGGKGGAGAEGPAVGAAAQPPPTPPVPPKEAGGKAKDSMKKNKGFLEGKNKLYGGKGSEEGEDGSFDVEFQKLMEAADPSFAANFSDPRAKHSQGLGGENQEDVLTQALSSLADMDLGVGASDGLDMDKLRKNAEESRYKSTVETLSKRKEAAAALDVEERAANKKAGKKMKGALAFSLKDGAGGLEVVIKFGEGEGGMLSLTDMDLEVSSDSLRLGTKYGDAWADLSGYNINAEEVKAKMSQKKRTLKVTLGRKEN